MGVPRLQSSVQQTPADIETPITLHESALPAAAAGNGGFTPVVAGTDGFGTPEVGNDGFTAAEPENDGLVPNDDGSDGLEITAAGGGLKPPNPNSVDPRGMPARPTVDREPSMPGEEADAAACDPDPSVVPAHEPEEIGMPEACGVDTPMPEQAVKLPIVEPSGEVPEIIGLTPGVPSSVAPSGIPMGPTAAPGPRPSGDVTPSGAIGAVPIPPTWPKAQL
jgi:hypothetical protein